MPPKYESCFGGYIDHSDVEDPDDLRDPVEYWNNVGREDDDEKDHDDDE